MSDSLGTTFDPNTYMLQENLTLREYQLKNLEIFKYFDHFCREHGITYYFNGGALIGALRHGGFVPWDCDIDVFLLRKDYEKFGKIWNKYADTDHYAYERSDRNYNMHAQCAGIKDNYTTYIRKHNEDEDMNHGIMLDILPLDYLSENPLLHQLQKVDGLIFGLFNAQRLPLHQGKTARIAAGIILSVFKSGNIRYKIWRGAEKRLSRFNEKNCSTVGELTAGVYQTRLVYDKEWFKEPKEIPFEDMMVLAPTCPEKYLEARYGNYMELPPVDEQVPKMVPAFIDINTPYIKYKGIKYCVNKKDGAMK